MELLRETCESVELGLIHKPQATPPRTTTSISSKRRTLTPPARPQTPNPLTDNQFIFSVNFEEAPALTGAYQVEGCEGTSPVLE